MNIEFSSTSGRAAGRRSRWLAGLGAALLVAAALSTAGTASAATRHPAPAASKGVTAKAATICTTQDLVVKMTANVGGDDFKTQTWPGGKVTAGTGACTVTVTRPSGRIDLVGTLGDPWSVEVPAGSGYSSATDIKTVSVPNCTGVAAAGSVVADRPSCSVAIGVSTGSTDSVTIHAVADPILTVDATLGNGIGLISSSPAGISCGLTCTAQFDQDTKVTLSETPDPSGGSHFVQWGGACSGGASTCVVTMSQAQSVTANFALNPVNTLTITKGGAGTGGVTSTPAGIDCGPTNTPACSHDFATGTLVTLTAAPSAGSTFAGWGGGACSGTGTCSVNLNANTSVIANFAPLASPRSLAVSKTGTGSGTVTSTPAGIACGATCAAQFDSGTFVTLTAAPEAGSTFAGWSGGGCSGTGGCQVNLTSDTTVTATFTAKAASTYRPDGLVALGSAKAIGNGIFNSTGAKQTKATKTKRGKTATFTWQVQNDGNATDSMKLSQRLSGPKGFTITYLVGTTNVTKKVAAGTYQKSVAAGASFKVTVKVKVTSKAKAGALKKLLLKATSVQQSSKSDTVGAKVTAK